jgi:HTH-type transcriptional regulator/antitoxin HigA
MSKTATIPLRDSYLELLHRFPLRPIRNEKELAVAESLIEELAVRGESDLDEGETDYLDTLGTFVEQYNDHRHPLPRINLSPLERLKYLMEQSGTAPNRLREILGCSQPLVSMILSGDRELSKDNIKVLARYFGVSADLFF